ALYGRCSPRFTPNGQPHRPFVSTLTFLSQSFALYRRPRRPTLFPYTTLFRSSHERRADREDPYGRDQWPGAIHHRRPAPGRVQLDRKSTRLNSSHVEISYAVFCLKKKKDNK